MGCLGQHPNLAVLNNGTNATGSAPWWAVRWWPAAESFGYDLDGNLTNNGLWNIAWDAEAGRSL